MTTITVPDDLYRSADEAARAFGSTADRKMVKALRDVVKRKLRAGGLGYSECSSCRGLAVEHSGVSDDHACLECGDMVSTDPFDGDEILDAASLKRWRVERLGMTQHELAAALGRQQQHVARWEGGKTAITPMRSAWLTARFRDLERQKSERTRP